MLKFVTTKPPRGRYPSGSGTPDREVTYRTPSHDTPPFPSSRVQHSPRSPRKHHPSYFRPHVLSSSSSSSSSPYRPDVSYGAPTFGGPQDYPEQHRRQPALGLSQQRSLQQPQPPLLHPATRYAYKQATPSESSGYYATLQFREPSADVFSPSSKEKKFPLEIKGLYSTEGETKPTPRIDTQIVQLKSTSQPAVSGQRGIRQPIKITPEFVGDKRVHIARDLVSGTDYDLAKAIPGTEDQQTGPKTTQYIINETLTRQKTSTTYIPPSGIEAHHIARSPPSTRRRLEYPQATSAEQQQQQQQQSPKMPKFPLSSTESQQVMTTCVPQVTSDLSNEALKKNQSSNRSIGFSSQTESSMSSTMRDMLNKSHEQSQFEGNLALDVIYITERIISMTFPSEGHDTIYTFHLKEVVQMLKTKHGDNYLILNLSEKRQDLTKANPQVKEFGWPDHLAPPLERLCSLCKAIDSWLNTDIRNVVVLHCKGGRSRIASVIAAYMHYSNICASADQALDRFAMKRFYDEKLGGLPLPSQQRYVRYFSGLLSGSIKINSNPLYLHHILIHGVPNFDTKGGCRPFIKVYQGMQPIFTSGVYNVTDNMQKVCISISPGIPLRGDILIKCYHKKSRSGQREVMWQCQFHTCAISDTSLIFSKQELDDAIMDPRFPDNGKVEFVFGPSSDVLVSVSGFKSDVTVPVDDNEESLARSDSYENFNRAVEAIDGYQGPSSSFSSRFTSSAVTTNNLNNNVSSDVVNPSYASQVYQTNQTNRRAAQTVEERTQLDELLSDLLTEQAYVSPTPRSPRSFQTAVQSQQTPISPGSGGGLAPGQNMSSARTINSSSRTYTTFSSADTHRHPDKLLIQRAEVSYKVPGQGEVKDHYTIAADPNDVLDTTPSKPAQQPQHPKGVPHNAFSYTAGLSSSQQSSSQRAEVVEHEIIRSQQASRDLQSPPSSRLPYRPDYDPRYETSSSSYQYSSLDGDTSSWLAQQQQKLKNFKEGRDSSGRTEQEKKLVNELRYAQNKYYTRRDQSDDEGRVFIDSQSRQTVQNGPTSPERVTSTYVAPQRSQSSTIVDGVWPQDQYYNTSYSTSSYTESHTYGGDKRSNKPPPSPTMQRSVLTTSAPAPIPARGSSKDYMRTRSSSSSSTWQQQGQQQQPQPRPLQRQQSDTIYDRNRDVEHILPRSYGSTHSTPPHSPRPISPSGPHSTTTYTTYRTIDRQRDLQDEMLRAKRVQQQQQQQQQAPPPVQQPPTQINHHYITEVFVHRTDVNKDKADSSTRLDELEKNLEAASQSIKSSQQQAVHQVPPPQQQQQMFEESMQTRSSRQYYTYQENKPEPPRVKEIEEDRIMLRPIGPGMQTLEPESAHTGTLGRPTTPGFPTGPATPPFPVSPRTPYQNTGLFGRFGGGHVISPTGTLQQPLQQQQHQTIQYQQYQSQQHYQTQSAHHDGHGQGTLHIDTSPKMLTAPQSPPSAGSPTSPSNFNTLRQQLSSAHSMSGSVISPGPHSMTGQSSPSVYFGLSRRGSLSSLTDTDMVHTTPKFVKDMSKYWYKPNITREEAIHLLKDKQPGTFVIRDSNSFPGAFGLALKVSTIPPNVQAKPSGDPQADLVRHFLIEPTPKGVRLRGCSNEPVFGSLAALVYQHSITPLALPCKLMLPEGDVDGVFTPESPMTATELNSAATLLAQGAACNVTFINSIDMESLTGPQAVAKAVKMTFENLAQGRTTVVHFKVSSQGITLTDNNRKLFFRRHYPVTAVTYCGMDPQDRRWKRELDAPGGQGDARIFGFVARKQGSTNENTCHIFGELDPEQPASAIVNFVTKVMIGQSKVKS